MSGGQPGMQPLWRGAGEAAPGPGVLLPDPEMAGVPLACTWGERDGARGTPSPEDYDGGSPSL